MRVFITGASGLIGGRIIDGLLGRGDQVVALSRRAGQGRPGLEWVTGDVTRPGPWQDRLAGTGGVIHLAGGPLAERRWTAEQKARLVESRVAGTRAVVQALAGPDRPRILLSASAVGYYGARGEEELDEPSAPGAGFLADLCVSWEREARAAMDLGVRTVCLRTGVVLSARGGALARMRTAFKLFAGGPLGDPAAWFPWIHEDDVAGLALHALDGALAGPVNVVAPAAVRMREFATALGRALHRPALMPVPQFALGALLGELATAINPGQKVVPRAALAAGYAFRYPALEAALAALYPG